MFITARQQGLIRCSACHQLNQDTGSHPQACGRCGSLLDVQTQPNLSKIWAILLAAIICYIPANLLPVMTLVSLGKDSSDTLMGGVIHFVQHGSWFLALIIFIASILIPLLKITVLLLILLRVQYRWCQQKLTWTRLFRWIEFVGRWSMVDIFVIALLVALVQFGEIASIFVGAGTLAFAAVVLLTIWATLSFDIRWLWQVCEKTNDNIHHVS